MFRKSKVQFLSIALLIAILPVTVFMVQQQQDIRQRAQMVDEAVRGRMLTVSPTTVKPGDSVAVYWNLGSGGIIYGDPRAQISVNPTTVQKGNPFQVTFKYVMASPEVQDAFVFIKQPPPCTPGGACPDMMETKVLTIYVNSCKDTPAETTYRDGVCDINIQNFPSSGNYLVQLTRNPNNNVDNSTDLLASATFTVTEAPTPTVTAIPTSAPTPTPTPSCPMYGKNTTMSDSGYQIVTLTPARDSSGTVIPIYKLEFTSLTNAQVGLRPDFLEVISSPYTLNLQQNNQYDPQAPVVFYIRKVTSGQPATVQMNVGTKCGTKSDFFGLGAAQGYNFPYFEFIKKVHAITPPPPEGLTGREYLQLFRIESTGNLYPVTQKMWLNCEYQTIADIVKPPPTSPIYSGKCQFEIPKDAKPDTYLLRILADEKTILAQSNVITVSTSPIAGCMSDADCATTGAINAEPQKCMRYGNYPGRCQPINIACAEVVTRACHTVYNECQPDSNQACAGWVSRDECVDFPNPCVVPPDWTTEKTVRTNVTTSVQLTGIGAPAGNTTPKHSTRDFYLTFFDTNNIPVVSQMGTLTFDVSSGTYKGSIGSPYPYPYPCPPGTNCLWNSSNTSTVPTDKSTGAISTSPVNLMMIPSMVQKGTTTQVQFEYAQVKPNPNDLFSVYKEQVLNSSDSTALNQPLYYMPDNLADIRVINFYASTCLATPNGQTREKGACNIDTRDLAPGRYSVRLFANNGFTERLAITEFMITERTCKTDADCANNPEGSRKCNNFKDYPGKCGGDVCTGATVKACNYPTSCPEGLGCALVCEEFPSSCFVPDGWVIEGQKPIPPNCPKTAHYCLYGEKVIYDDPNSCPRYECLPSPNPTLNGSYTVKISTSQFLRKQFPGIITVKEGATITLPTITMQTGDINGDNVINILDYNMIINCFGRKISSDACKQSPHFPDGIGPLADLNDDGTVDGTDYNLFIKSLATKEGD